MMGLRFFLDHCVPMSVARALRDAQHEALLLRDSLTKDSPDDAVLAEAVRLEAIAVSLDGHFSDLTRFDPANYLGIIALQLHDHPEVLPTLLRRLCDFLADHPDSAFYRGRLLLVEPHRIRLRP